MKHLQKKPSWFLIMSVILLTSFTFIFTECRFEEELGTLVETKNGTVQGAEDENNTWVWKGIPFAKPPLAELRWKAPRPVKKWSGVLEADEFCSACPQFDGTGTGTVTGNEDCLYLNIWRPATQERKLPVHFWIHGGGNSIGSAAGSDGKYIAGNGNMVVVSIQYRLGPFGWFTHPDLRTGKNPLDNSGNYGNLDIILALKWVKENIKAFGGDPNNVMIVGESAGGMNVYTMIISRLAGGLFSKAMTQSGGFWTTTMADADAEAETVVATLLAADGLTDVPDDDLGTYLRGKTAEVIMSVYPEGVGGMIYFGADARLGGYLDGFVLPANGIDALSSPGTYNQVTMIAGANKEESKLFMLGDFFTMTPEEYQAAAEIASAAWIDGAVDTPATMMLSNDLQPAIYAYQLNYGAYNETGYNAWPTTPVNLAVMFGACHALDIPFFWGDFSNSLFFTDLFREDNREGYEALAEGMMAYVAQFAHTGDPGDGGGVSTVEWEPWSNAAGEAKRIVFDANDTEVLIEMSSE